MRVHRRSLLLLLLLAVSSTACSLFPEFDPEEKQRQAREMQRFYDELADAAEPTVDIEQVAVGQTVVAGTGEERVGIGIKTAGGPAPDTAYSNFVEIQVVNVALQNSMRSIIVQRHDNVDSVIVDGLEEEDVVIVQTPWGHYVEFPRGGWNPADTVFDIILGFLGEPGGTFIDDELDDGPKQFEDTEPVESILDEITEVFVPA
jgi:hypothetical protein